MPYTEKQLATAEKRKGRFNSGYISNLAMEQYNMGMRYDLGVEGYRKNTKKAFDYYMLAANNGDPDAQNSVGSCYFRGEGIVQNLGEAKKWFEVSASQGNLHAIDSLVIMNSSNEFFYI